jgi:hypothetical protein
VDTVERGGSLATLYADRIAVMAAGSGLDLGTLLGRVMAHEIGHLLLGTTAHQPHGLMRARWSRSALQFRVGLEWQFSRDDIERIDENLERRKAHAALSPRP